MESNFDASTGLFPGGFSFEHEDCDRGGNLSGLQGMVMAR